MKLIKLLALIFFITLIIRLFCFEFYQVTSGSMNNSLFEGDIIFVNKFSTGIRKPVSVSEIPWINIFYLLFQKNVLSDEKWKYHKKLFNSQKIKNNEILVFNRPLNEREIMVKRCIGIPEDSIYISDSCIIINNRPFFDNASVINVYQVWYKSKYEDTITNIGDSLQILNNENFSNYRIGYKELILNKEEYNKLRKLEILDSFKLFINARLLEVAYNHQKFGQVGILKVPYEGMKIFLRDSIFRCYKSIVMNFEDKIEKNNQSYFKLRQNYYVVLGDNRNSSIDSRYWGFLPEDHIIGKVEFVLFSIDHTKSWYNCFRWRRFLKRIN